MKTPPTSMSCLARSLAIATLISAAWPVQANESQEIKELAAKLEQSLKTIEALSARLAQVEKQAQTTNKSPDTASQRVADLERTVAQLSESASRHGDDTGLPIHGFMDVGAGFQSKGNDTGNFPQSGGIKDKLRGFNAGSLDFYLTPQFGDRVRALAELNVEYDRAGSAGVDLERLQLGYTASDNNTIWAGRFHTPYGYWNTSFHHGAHIQTSLTRPRFLEFEDKGGIVPAHSVGVWLTGKTPLTAGKLTYDAYVANGKRVMAGDNDDKSIEFNGFTDPKGSKALGFNLGYVMPSGWKLGVHGFHDAVTTYAGTGTDYSSILSDNKFNMIGGYAALDGDDWEWIAEYYGFHNRTDSNAVAGLGSVGSHSSKAWFVQGAFHLSETFTPYARYERAALDVNDVLFNSLNAGRSYNRMVVGIRYDIDHRSAVKLEVSGTSEKSGSQLDTAGAGPTVDTFGATSYSRVQAQYSLGF